MKGRLGSIAASLALAATLITGSATAAEEANDSIRLRLLGGYAGESDTEIAGRRLDTGLNLQWAVLPPSGRMFDPESFRASVDGEAVQAVGYSTLPELTLVFILLDAPERTTTQTLELSGAVLGGARQALTTLSIPPSMVRPEPTPTGEPRRFARIVDQQGQPVADAFFFGQRREDMLARTDATGRVEMTSYTRNTPDPHYAWSAESWTVACDPRSTPTIELTPLPAGVSRGWLTDTSLAAFPATRLIEAVDEDGKPLDGCVAMVERTFLRITNATGRTSVPLFPSAEETEVLLMMPGYETKRAAIPRDGGSGVVRATLKRRAKPLF